jgi:hypothetical protein
MNPKFSIKNAITSESEHFSLDGSLSEKLYKKDFVKLNFSKNFLEFSIVETFLNLTDTLNKLLETRNLIIYDNQYIKADFLLDCVFSGDMESILDMEDIPNSLENLFTKWSMRKYLPEVDIEKSIYVTAAILISGCIIKNINQEYKNEFFAHFIGRDFIFSNIEIIVNKSNIYTTPIDAFIKVEKINKSLKNVWELAASFLFACFDFSDIPQDTSLKSHKNLSGIFQICPLIPEIV